jgi:hypothetical protein
MTTTKQCKDCIKIKHYSEFTTSQTNLDGLYPYCRVCQSVRKEIYRKTKNGLVTGIYSDQRSSSVSRSHDMPNYSNHDLRKWVHAQHNFDKLYNNWVISGFDKMLKPSVDRLDDYKPYTFSNIRLTTWQMNFDKGHSDMVNGINNKQSTSVSQYTKNMRLIDTYYSISEAKRRTKINNISSACSGLFKTSGGYIWKYS